MVSSFGGMLAVDLEFLLFVPILNFLTVLVMELVAVGYNVLPSAAVGFVEAARLAPFAQWLVLLCSPPCLQLIRIECLFKVGCPKLSSLAMSFYIPVQILEKCLLCF